MNRAAFFALLVLLAVWQVISGLGLIPPYMLPSPISVAKALAGDFPLLMHHLCRTLFEAGAGLGLSAAAAIIIAVAMDVFLPLKRAAMPLLLLTQTVPVIALAPLLVLWLGYGVAPKIALVFLTCFFPLVIALSGGFGGADADTIRLLRSMGAKKKDIYCYIKFPQALPAFFSGFRIACSYAIIGAVIAEWLGGSAGLGVYMTRVRKSYSFDKMFAAIILVSLLSIALLKLVEVAERKLMPWREGAK